MTVLHEETEGRMGTMAVTTPTADRFRQVMGHVPTAVAIVTGYADGRPSGLAVGTFTSISLAPLLVGFFPSRTSTSWPAIRRSGRFCVNVLAEDQRQLSHRFAVSGGNKFAGLDYADSPLGTGPAFPDALALVECAVDRELPVGDHQLVVGKVLGLSGRVDAGPLVFHRGSYAGLRR